MAAFLRARGAGRGYLSGIVQGEAGPEVVESAGRPLAFDSVEDADLFREALWRTGILRPAEANLWEVKVLTAEALQDAQPDEQERARLARGGKSGYRRS